MHNYRELSKLNRNLPQVYRLWVHFLFWTQLLFPRVTEKKGRLWQVSDCRSKANLNWRAPCIQNSLIWDQINTSGNPSFNITFHLGLGIFYLQDITYSPGGKTVWVPYIHTMLQEVGLAGQELLNFSRPFAIANDIRVDVPGIFDLCPLLVSAISLLLYFNSGSASCRNNQSEFN